jgi:hypothetical protein
MANGVAAKLVPPSTPASPSISPRVGEGREGIENQIGKTLVAFAALSVQAFQEVQGGKMSAATRSQGGDLIAQLYWIRAELGETEFVAIMHQQARLRLCYGTNLSAETAVEIAGDILGAVNKVVATMRAMN